MIPFKDKKVVLIAQSAFEEANKTIDMDAFCLVVVADKDLEPAAEYMRSQGVNANA